MIVWSLICGGLIAWALYETFEAAHLRYKMNERNEQNNALRERLVQANEDINQLVRAFERAAKKRPAQAKR